MIICLCLGLTEKDVAKKIREGAQSVEDVVPASVLREGCGTCFADLNGLIRRLALPVHPSQELSGISSEA